MVVVGGEEGREGFVLTPQNLHMLPKDSFYVRSCSSESFDSELMPANGSEYG